MKNLILKYNRFMLRLDICAHMLFYSKDERLLQYLTNRIPREVDPFYWEDEYLLHHLQKKDEELKWSKNE